MQKNTSTAHLLMHQAGTKKPYPKPIPKPIPKPSRLHTLEPCLYTFPDPQVADPEGFGLVCVGADLAPSTLVHAYAQGLFPWFSEGEPIRWWSPEPRCVFYTQDYAPQKSLLRASKKSKFVITLNADFTSVIAACAHTPRGAPPRKEGVNPESEGSPSTWITDDMIAAYTELHKLGFAHSVEVWQQDEHTTDSELVGGLYGIKLGAGFFGESMFHTQTDASKYAFWFLAKLCARTGIGFIDGQLANPHLHRLGAVDIPRAQFFELLYAALEKPSPDWQRVSWRLSERPLAVSDLVKSW